MHKARDVRAWYGRLAAVALVAALASAAAADLPATIGPVDGYLGDGVFVDVKSPPLATSDPFQTTWGLHLVAPLGNYAGFLFQLSYDSHELSFLSVHETGIHTGGIEYGGGLCSGVTFTGSQSGTETAWPIAVWIDPSSAMYSGITLPPSTLIPLFQILGHAKNTTQAYNSDTDITAIGLPIFHNTEPITHLTATVLGYLTPSFAAWATVPGQGVWTTVGPSASLPPSAFFAPFGATVGGPGYGIEHVPEPASMVLLLGGAGAVLIGRVRRRRR